MALVVPRGFEFRSRQFSRRAFSLKILQIRRGFFAFERPCTEFPDELSIDLHVGLNQVPDWFHAQPTD